jgi:hypothetical protein
VVSRVERHSRDKARQAEEAYARLLRRLTVATVHATRLSGYWAHQASCTTLLHNLRWTTDTTHIDRCQRKDSSTQTAMVVSHDTYVNEEGCVGMQVV